MYFAVVLSDRGWNLLPPHYHFIEKKQFFNYNLRKKFNIYIDIIEEQFRKVI